MAYKYQRFDRQLFAWLRANRDHATTALAVEALKVTNKSQIRHISRRFSQLQDAGTLTCTLQGTTRICKLVADIPDFLSRQPWRQKLTQQVQQHLAVTGRADVKPCDLPSIRAVDSIEFEARGGIIQRLPSSWDAPATGSQPLGDSFRFDD